MARPIITTDVPGCRAVVDPGVSGLVCDVKSAKSLAASMEIFLSRTPEQQRAMGFAGRKKMEREYDQRLVVDAYCDAIGELTRQGR
jgi:glycosyltransferase involved in cell wall biosynthesis